ncbi:MAG: hypothetical protein M3N57_12745 [Actinomycetota bacterium]|nr:hypothetical protein [Actinomycetota bacterium]
MRAVFLVVLVGWLAACGGAAEPTADLVGTLGGDPDLEGGCAWLDVEAERSTVDADRVQPSWPQGYRVELEPVRLVGPDGRVVAEAGDVVMADGTLRPDVVTVCMVGPVFDVTRIHGEG